MTTTSEHNAILDKTLELCQAILDQPGIQDMRRDIDVFLADDSARMQYQAVMEQSELLQHKQQSAEALTEQEVEEFERERRALFDNPVAKAFLDAQQEIHRLQQSVIQHVTKTLELGRVPTAEDFRSCQPGCSCGH